MGELGDVFENLCAMSNANLLQHLAPELGNEELEQQRSTLAADLVLARAFIEFELKVKFDFARRLPFRLCALAHPQTVKRREVAEAILAEFDTTDPARHHPLTQQFLREGLPFSSLTEPK